MAMNSTYFAPHRDVLPDNQVQLVNTAWTTHHILTYYQPGQLSAIIGSTLTVMLPASVCTLHSVDSPNIPPTSLSDWLHVMSRQTAYQHCHRGRWTDWSCSNQLEELCVKCTAADINKVVQHDNPIWWSCTNTQCFHWQHAAVESTKLQGEEEGARLHLDVCERCDEFIILYKLQTQLITDSTGISCTRYM